MPKYQVYHDHGQLPWIVEAEYFEAGVVLISPGAPSRAWITGDRPAPPTHINDGVLRLHDDNGNLVAAFPPGEWVHVREVEEANANQA